LAVLFQQGFGSVKPNAALSAQWYSKAIEHSKDRRAQTRLGIAYLDGRGVPQYTTKGQGVLLSAAKAGSSEAQYRLELLDQPAIQAAQWMSVAAMTDATYVGVCTGCAEQGVYRRPGAGRTASKPLGACALA
jgi:TPR repeat protein